jgi:hypothetical protein
LKNTTDQQRSVFPQNKPGARLRQATKEGTGTMLETLIIVLVVLWLLGLVTSYTMGGLIHALLVIAIVVILIRVIQGRRVL